jgi:hypothetical protein
MKKIMFFTLALFISAAIFAGDDFKEEKNEAWLDADDAQSHKKRKEFLYNFLNHARFPLTGEFKKSYAILKNVFTETSTQFLAHMKLLENSGKPIPGKLDLAHTLKTNVEKDICSNEDLSNAKNAFKTLSIIVTRFTDILRDDKVTAKRKKNQAKRSNRKKRDALQGNRKLIFAATLHSSLQPTIV